MIKLIKVFWYSMFLNYHINKQFKIDIKYSTVYKYHLELAKHYYKKAFGMEYDE